MVATCALKGPFLRPTQYVLLFKPLLRVTGSQGPSDHPDNCSSPAPCPFRVFFSLKCLKCSLYRVHPLLRSGLSCSSLCPENFRKLYLSNTLILICIPKCNEHCMSQPQGSERRHVSLPRLCPLTFASGN